MPVLGRVWSLIIIGIATFLPAFRYQEDARKGYCLVGVADMVEWRPYAGPFNSHPTPGERLSDLPNYELVRRGPGMALRPGLQLSDARSTDS